MAIGTRLIENGYTIARTNNELTETVNYIIFKDGSYTKTKNGTTSKIDYINTNNTPIQNALDDLA